MPLMKKTEDDDAAADTYDSDADAAAYRGESFEHRGPKCLLTLVRSLKPTLGSVPSACVLVSPLYIHRL